MFSQCGAAVAFASFRTARLIWQDGGYGFTSFGTVYFGAIRSHVFTSFRLESSHWSGSYGVDSLIVSNCFREGWCLRLLFLHWFPVVGSCFFSTFCFCWHQITKTNPCTCF